MRFNGCPIAKPTLANESTCFYAGQVKQDSVEKSFKRKLEIKRSGIIPEQMWGIVLQNLYPVK